MLDSEANKRHNYCRDLSKSQGHSKRCSSIFRGIRLQCEDIIIERASIVQDLGDCDKNEVQVDWKIEGVQQRNDSSQDKDDNEEFLSTDKFRIKCSKRDKGRQGLH